MILRVVWRRERVEATLTFFLVRGEWMQIGYTAYMNPEDPMQQPIIPDHEGDAFFDRSLYEAPKKTDKKKRSVSESELPTKEDAASEGTFRERLTKAVHEIHGEGSPTAEMILRQGEKIPQREESPLHRAAHVKKKKFR